MGHALSLPGGSVLVVAEHPWPSTSGGQLRTASIAAVLAQLGPLTVISLDMPEPPRQMAGAVQRYWARRRSQPTRVVDLATGVVRGNHVALQRAIAAGLPQALGSLLADLRPDVVILRRPFFGPFMATARRAGARVVIDPDESLERVSRSVVRSRGAPSVRARALADLLAVGRMERRDFRTADQIWAGSKIEQQALAAVAGGVGVRVVPNVASAIPDVVEPPGEIRRIGFVGYFRHPPNEEAAIELMTRVMPVIRAAGGPNELILIGREPTTRMRRVAEATGDVVLTGEVDDTKIPLRDAGVLVSPIRSGGGTRLKVIEAISAGVPVISTSFGAEGLDLQGGEDILIAETPAEFAEAVRKLMDPAVRQRLVTSAHAAMQRSNSPAAMDLAVRQALELVLSSPR